MPSPQAARKTDVTLLPIRHTPGPNCNMTGKTRGGIHEQVDLGLELGAKIRQVAPGSVLGSTCPFDTPTGTHVLPRPTEEALASHVRTIYVAFTVYTVVMPFYRQQN